MQRTWTIATVALVAVGVAGAIARGVAWVRDRPRRDLLEYAPAVTGVALPSALADVEFVQDLDGLAVAYARMSPADARATAARAGFVACDADPPGSGASHLFRHLPHDGTNEVRSAVVVLRPVNRAVPPVGQVLCLTGHRPCSLWSYVIDTQRGNLWAVFHFADHSGDCPDGVDARDDGASGGSDSATTPRSR